MGKKKVIQKTQEELIKESEAVSDTVARKTGEAGTKQRVDNGRVYIHASYNNTLITVTDYKGNVVTWMSAGSLGFSGPKKATPFAASRVAEAVVEKVKKSGPFNVEVLIRGVGKGRDSAVRTLASKGLNILAIRDVTPVPHNGPRPPKVRRV
ncbi:30S ribosomal protein S11 [Candidatus Jorgensenbacteria bacterium]|nr:30S ribosomal protein S11 [Candidatus Jorgensenbacteria bacterium]